MWLCSAFFVIHISMCASSVVFAMQKRLYESMERHLEAAIEKAESLARDNQQGKRWCVEVCPRLTFFMDGDIYYETKKKL